MILTSFGGTAEVSVAPMRQRMGVRDGVWLLPCTPAVRMVHNVSARSGCARVSSYHGTTEQGFTDVIVLQQFEFQIVHSGG